MHRSQAVFLDAFQLRFPFAARHRDRLLLAHIHMFLQAIPRQGAIHCPRVHINIIQRARHELRVRALAARTRPINGNDNIFQSKFLTVAAVYDRRPASIRKQFFTAQWVSCFPIQNRRSEAVGRRRSQLLEKVRERLLHAGRIFNFYPGNFQS